MRLRQFAPLYFLVLLPLCSTVGAEDLVLRLVVPKSTLCVSDEEVTAELELRNSSRETVVINAAAIGTSVDVLALYSTEQNAPLFGSFHVLGDSMKQQAPHSITLNPGASHRIVGTFTLADASFDEAGFYKIRTDYFATDARSPTRKRHVLSNWVIMLVERCSETQKK